MEPGTRVRIIVKVGEKPYFYKGTLLYIDNEIVKINDDRDGEMLIGKSEIISMSKDKPQGEQHDTC